MSARSATAAGKRAAKAALHRLPEDDPERYLLLIDHDEDGFDTDILFEDDLLHVEDQ